MDEESSEPVTGAMKVWGVQASSSQRAGTRAVYRLEKKGGFSYRSLFSGLMNCPYGSRSEPKRAVRSALGHTLLTHGVDQDSTSNFDDEDLEEEVDYGYDDLLEEGFDYGYDEDLEEEFDYGCVKENPSNLEVAGVLNSATVPAPSRPPPQRSAATPTQGNTLSSIIAAQQADGSWTLDSTLTKVVDKPQTVIEDVCPVECKGIVAAVWLLC